MRLIALAVGGSIVAAQSSAAAVGRANRVIEKPRHATPQYTLHCPAKFVTCLAWDKFRDAVWVGTEGQGVYEYRPSAATGARWRHFGKSNGLGDNSCYALEVDDGGRIWAGTERHGVDVFASRAKGWRRYDVLPLKHGGEFGPLGSHPTCIAVDPYTHAVWMATEAGISIYSTHAHAWRYLTTTNGLPTNQISAISFLPQKRILLGTRCQGLEIGTFHRRSPQARAPQGDVLAALRQFRDPYTWRAIGGPAHTPPRAAGRGLPSGLINSTCVASNRPHMRRRGRADGLAIYAGTDSGLAFSSDNGGQWRFEQGRDYVARVRGLLHPPARFRAPPAAVLRGLLPAEHVTCVVRDRTGNIWLGFWRDGYAVLNARGRIIHETDLDPKYPNDRKYVRAMLALPDGLMVMGSYGGGIWAVRPPEITGSSRPISRDLRRIAQRWPAKGRPVVGYPRAAAVPDSAEMIAMRDALLRIRRARRAGTEMIPLNADWTTRGNWVDHYGKMWSLEYSMTGLDVGGGYDEVCFLRSNAWVNPHWRAREAARHWLVRGWRNTRDPRSLQDLFHGGRTEASDDDHGETYPRSISGPNLYMTLDLPVGAYVLSAYLFNVSADKGRNACRDYLVRVAGTPDLGRQISRINGSGKHPFQPVEAFSRGRPVAAARCEDFEGGVYKRFFVRVSPAGFHYRGLDMGCVTICIARNASLNAICQGLFIDRLGRLPYLVYGRSAGPRPPVAMTYPKPVPKFKIGQPYIPADFGFMKARPNVTIEPPPPMPRACYDAGAVMQQLLHLRRANAGWFAANGPIPIILLARFLVAGHARGDTPPAAWLTKSVRRAIWSPRFVASLLRDVPLWRQADDFYPKTPEFAAEDETWAWDKRTAHPRITDAKIWPLPKIFALYHAWWEAKEHQCLNWKDKQWLAK